MLQSDMGHLKESMDTKMNSFQTKFESNFARTISGLDAKVDSKFDNFDLKFSALDFKIDLKFDKVDSKFDILKADFGKQLAEFEADSARQEAKLAGRMFFAVSVLISLCPTF